MENQPQDHLNQVSNLETTSSELTQPRIQALEALYPLCEQKKFPENLLSTLRNHLTPDIQAQLTNYPNLLQDPALQEFFATKVFPRIYEDPEYLSTPSKKQKPDGTFRTMQEVLNEDIL
jgi:hypothetical protein